MAGFGSRGGLRLPPATEERTSPQSRGDALPVSPTPQLKAETPPTPPIPSEKTGIGTRM